MSSSYHFTTNTERRQELRNWMYLNGITVKRFAKVIKISDAHASNMIGQSTMPTRHHAKILKTFPDLPAELLPKPLDIPSGPRPKGLSTDAFFVAQA